VWVTNQADESVTEFSPTTLDELNVLVSGNLPMVGPIAYGDGYVFTVSPPGSSPMVSQITPSPATVTWMMCNTNGLTSSMIRRHWWWQGRTSGLSTRTAIPSPRWTPTPGR